MQEATGVSREVRTLRRRTLGTASGVSGAAKWLEARGVQTAQAMLSPEVLDMLRQCFEYVDQDGSGCIDAEELAVIFRLLKLPATLAAAQVCLLNHPREKHGLGLGLGLGLRLRLGLG